MEEGSIWMQSIVVGHGRALLGPPHEILKLHIISVKLLYACIINFNTYTVSVSVPVVGDEWLKVTLRNAIERNTPYI